MAETTKIEWADATVNPWWGCTKVSEACRNCYADALAHRWGKDVWGPGKPREDHRAGATKLARKLQRQAEREGRRLRVFCLSMGDWLDPEVPAEWLADLLALIEACPNLDWLLLTKRPELWSVRVTAAWLNLSNRGLRELTWAHWIDGEPPPNVWVGTTVEDQERADERIPALLEIPARTRFLSCEPLLGPLALKRHLLLTDRAESPAQCLCGHGHGFTRCWNTGGVARSCHHRGCPCPGFRRAPGPGIHQIIVGGESGRGARPMHPEWARSLRDQAQAAGVAFFFKQWGDWAPEGTGAFLDWHPEMEEDDPRWRNVESNPNKLETYVPCYRAGKAKAGRLLDGREWDEVPARG